MELFRLLGTIAIDSTGAKATIDETTEQAQQSESKISKAFSKVGSAAVKVGKAMATGLAVGATAVGALTKSALDNYANYEQLVGGVETLFGAGGKSLEEYATSVGKTTEEVKAEYQSLMSAQETVLSNADEAYKTAGMSANEYMETVTSFSASLIQSLDGDTAKAAEKANQAIIDMSDNANKMGTDMESIQNAYQGFAKQNYTMLDNLKLGYGGTKEEMQRLLEDAQAISGVEYDVSSYADVVDAIHVIQEEMGIAGTTASEASSTISGSISSMKSSWMNLVAGLGSEDADLSLLIDRFVQSVVTASGNVLPRIEKILGGIAQLVSQLAPKIVSILPGMLDQLLPPLIQGAVVLVGGIVEALPTILQVLIDQMPYIITQLTTALITVFPQLLTVIKQLVGQIWDYISLELLKTEVSFEDALGKITEIFNGAWGVIQDIWNSIGQPIWDMISYAVEYSKEAFSEAMPEIMEFFGDASAGIEDTWNSHLKPTFEAIGDFISNVIQPVFELVFQTVVIMVKTAFSTISKLWKGSWKPIFDGICDFLTGVFTWNWEKALQGILNIVTGRFRGILVAIETPMNLVKDTVSNAIEFIKEKFNFDWQLPKIKLPHFKIDGEFSLNPPSVPKFGIEWYKNGAVLTQATAFGINPATGNIMAGGEAGAEAVAPIDVLQSYVSEAVASQNEGMIAVLKEILNALLINNEAILSMDENMGGNLREALEDVRLSIGEREFGRLVRKAVVL